MSIVGINIQYFKGSIALPTSNKIEGDFQSDYIDVYEEEFLTQALGRDLYNEFKTGLEQTVIEQKWLDLRDGKDYTVQDNNRNITVSYKGLKNSGQKISPISHYVYVKYVAENYRQMTALGMSSVDKENARDVSIRENLTKVYHELVNLTGQELPSSDEWDRILYPEDIDEDQLHKFNPSLINFLYYNQSEYPSWYYLYPDIYGVNYFDI